MGISVRIKSVKRCLSRLLLLFLLLSVAECRRGGGGSRSSSRSSHSSPSYSSHSSPSYSSHSSPSYSSHSSPSHSRPSQPSQSSYSHPASLSYPSHYQAPSRPSQPSHPASQPASHPSSAPYRPIGFDNVKPVSSSSSGSHAGTSGSHPGPSGPPNYGFNPPATHGTGSHTGSYGFKPPVTQGSSHGSNPQSTGFKASAPPLGSANTGTGHSDAAKAPSYGWKQNSPVGPPSHVKPVGNAPPPGAPYSIHPPPYTPHNPGVAPPAYNPAHNNPAGYGPPPPAYNPAGYGHAPAYTAGHANYPQQQYHPGGYGHPNQPHYAGSPGTVTNIHVTNVNTNNNHHYGGGYGSGYHYNGYPSYHYSSGDTGSGTLGFFLGYSLAKVTTPTYYSHPGFYNGYTPRYDHYEVHHYYHNRGAVPAESTIQANTIVGCVGDSGTICPTGTKSLCTSNGAILCVASASTTVPCSDQKQGNCVTTTIPCVNGTGNCEIGTNKTVTIPCISSAKVPGNITYINNTIIVNNTTIINNNFNGTTNATVTASNSSTVSNASSVSALAALNNVTGNGTNTTTIEVRSSLPLNVTADDTRTKRETSKEIMNEFCVTILALPAERKPTEQENILSKGTSIFSKFLVRALGAN